MCTHQAAFLNLPSELRYQIYEDCFDLWFPGDADTRKAMILVCRQIRNEVFPLLLRDARSSDSIASFIAWTSVGPPKLLQYIEHLVCAWTVPSLTHLPHEVLEESAKEDASVKSCSLGAVRGLGRAFCSISNLRNLRLNFSIPSRTLRAASPGSIGSHQDQEMLLCMIARSCPMIEELGIITDLINVNCLQGFHNLTSLWWSGYALSTPQEALTILKSLKPLHTIILERFPEKYDHEHFRTSTAELTEHLSLTPEVVKGLRPLRRFSIRHVSSTMASDFLTLAMLKALSSHRQSLVDLDLWTNHEMSSAELEEILRISSSWKLISLRLIVSRVRESLTDDWIKSRIGTSLKNCVIELHHIGENGDRSFMHNFRR